MIRFFRRFGVTAAFAATVLTGLSLAPPARAVPSFARQTGLACEACHTVFPELTPFGRRFKLGGYTLTTRPMVSDVDLTKHSTLSLQDLPPLSIMAQVSSTWWNKTLPDSGSDNGSLSSQNGQTEFPQQLSLFYAGKIADNMGAFFQMTYQQASGSFSIDNSDIRFADHSDGGDLVYGLTLNNNPTVQDVWNSTPAWGAPFFAAPTGSPTPTAAPLITSLGAKVGGLGAYALYKDQYYLEFTAYRSALQGVGHPYDSTSSSVIDGVAPYWRAAYETQWNKHALEFGTFGLWAKYLPTSSGAQGIHPGVHDTYLDTGLDLQYQYLGEENNFSLLGSYLHENVEHNMNNLNTGVSGVTSAAKPITGLTRWQATASYFFRRRYGGSLSFTKTTGSHDSIAYAPGISKSTGTSGFQSGYGKGKPDSQFETLELDYMPWLNTKILAQYTIYNQFNGGSGAYDGSTGRKASDNNTALIGLWLAF